MNTYRGLGIVSGFLINSRTKILMRLTQKLDANV